MLYIYNNNFNYNDIYKTYIYISTPLHTLWSPVFLCYFYQNIFIVLGMIY